MKLFIALTALALHINAYACEPEPLDATTHLAVTQVVKNWEENPTQRVETIECMNDLEKLLEGLVDKTSELLGLAVMMRDPTLNKEDLISSYSKELGEVNVLLTNPLLACVWQFGDCSSMAPVASQCSQGDKLLEELKEATSDEKREAINQAFSNKFHSITEATFFSFDAESHSIGFVINPNKGLAMSLSGWKIHMPTVDSFKEDLNSQKGTFFDQITKTQNNIFQARLMVASFQENCAVIANAS